MGTIKQKLLIRGTEGTKTLEVLFDSGASHSVISEEATRGLCKIVPLDEPMEFTLANGEKIHATGTCGFNATLKAPSKQKCPIAGTAYVSEEFKGVHQEDLIIGVPLLQEYQIRLQFGPKGKDQIDLSRCVRRVDRL